MITLCPHFFIYCIHLYTLYTKRSYLIFPQVQKCQEHARMWKQLGCNQLSFTLQRKTSRLPFAPCVLMLVISWRPSSLLVRNLFRPQIYSLQSMKYLWTCSTGSRVKFWQKERSGKTVKLSTVTSESKGRKWSVKVIICDPMSTLW